MVATRDSGQQTQQQHNDEAKDCCHELKYQLFRAGQTITQLRQDLEKPEAVIQKLTQKLQDSVAVIRHAQQQASRADLLAKNVLQEKDGLARALAQAKEEAAHSAKV